MPFRSFLRNVFNAIYFVAIFFTSCNSGFPELDANLIIKNPFFSIVLFGCDRCAIYITVSNHKFDINTYGDEPSIKTTLLQGEVRITRNGILPCSNQVNRQRQRVFPEW